MDKTLMMLLPFLMGGQNNNEQMINALISSMTNKDNTSKTNPMLGALLANMMNSNKTDNNKNNMMEMFTKMMNTNKNKDFSDNQPINDVPTMLTSLFNQESKRSNTEPSGFKPIDTIANKKINELLYSLMKKTE